MAEDIVEEKNPANFIARLHNEMVTQPFPRNTSALPYITSNQGDRNLVSKDVIFQTEEGGETWI